MLSIFLSILPIFLLIATGYALKMKFVQDEVFWKAAEKLTYYVFFPALLVLKICESDFTQNTEGPALLATIAATGLVGLIVFATRLFCTIKDDLFTSIFQGGIRYNSYVFIAMSQSLFGTIGVATSGIFIAYMIVITNIASVIVMNRYGSENKKSMSAMISTLLSNPLIIGALSGVVLNMANLKPQGAIKDYLYYLSDAATPLSLLAVGAGLNLVMHSRKVIATAYSTALKLVAMPVITILFLKLFNATGLPANIALLYASVPCAGNAYILARQMGGDAEAMASIVTWTTLVSVLSITLILSWLSF